MASGSEPSSPAVQLDLGVFSRRDTGDLPLVLADYYVCAVLRMETTHRVEAWTWFSDRTSIPPSQRYQNFNPLDRQLSGAIDANRGFEQRPDRLLWMMDFLSRKRMQQSALEPLQPNTAQWHRGNAIPLVHSLGSSSHLCPGAFTVDRQLYGKHVDEASEGKRREKTLGDGTQTPEVGV